uniref:Uncharacterized protein n=1 Tax=Anguilla anguilla TaxID=7936 RepID=A0A0E9Q935_ANGAN
MYIYWTRALNALFLMQMELYVLGCRRHSGIGMNRKAHSEM